MRILTESLLHSLAPVIGAVLLCATGGTAMAQSLPMRSKLQPQVTTDQSPVGFRVKSQALTSFQPISLDVSKFAFTAPATTAAAKAPVVERSFSFTPSRGNGQRGLSVAVTARSTVSENNIRMASAAVADGAKSNAYNVDLSVGYHGFSVTGGMSRVDTGIGGIQSQGVDIGLGYASDKFKTGISATADRDERMFVTRPGARDPRYGLEASGLFALSPGVSVGGSVRYRLAPPSPTPLDPNRDDRAVMLGGAVAF